MTAAVGKWYTKGLSDIVGQLINPTTDTLKLIAVGTGYVFDPDHLVAEDGTNSSTDVRFNEITATNYTPGWHSSSRKTVTITKSENNTANRIELNLANVTWTGLGGGVDSTIGSFILLKEGGSNDTTSRLIAYFERKDGSGNYLSTGTNGSDVTVNFTGNTPNLTISV